MHAFLVVFIVTAVTVPMSLGALGTDFIPNSVGAGSPELHIDAESVLSIKSARVERIVGTTMYLVMKWQNLPMYFTMKTDRKTTVTKRYGGSAKVSEVSVGDYIDAEGDFFIGSDFFGLSASKIKDWSLQEESAMFSGKIVELNGTNFTLETPEKKITVVLADSGTIIKGSVAIPWYRMAQGDTVVLADGIYDYSTDVLSASSITIYHPKDEFKPHNFEGILKTIEGTNTPTVLIVTVDGVDHTVGLSDSTAILRKNRTPAKLARFVVGDTIRFYGAIQEIDKILSDQFVVPAEVLRNLNL